MDILNSLINEKGGELVSSLLKQGFDNNSASSFLREAGNGIGAALTSGKIDLSQGNIGDKAGDLINTFDISALAASVGINPEMAKNGLAIVAPKLLQLLQQQLGDNQGLASLLSGATKGGDLLNMAKKFF